MHFKTVMNKFLFIFVLKLYTCSKKELDIVIFYCEGIAGHIS